VKPHAYIVKPFTKEELYAAIEIAFSNFAGNRKNTGFEQKGRGAAKAYTFVRDGYVFRKIFFNDLLYLESDANYVTLYLMSQKKVMVRSTLNEFIEQLDPETFIRIHRSYSVNIHQVDDVFPTEVSVSGIKIPVGKSYKEDLFKALGINEA